jgi:hypothetical protein
MQHTLQLRLFMSLALAAASYAQQSPDPTGHWKGAVLAPARQFRFEVDLLKNEHGTLVGYAALPDENLKGIPLKLTVSGNSIKFHAREDQPFDGVISPDAKSIDGEYSIEGNILPFRMSRTGDAVAVKPEQGVPLPAGIEGEWQGTLQAGGESLKLILILSSVSGGSVARVINLGQGGLELPVIVRQSTPELLIEITSTATWTGMFNGKELSGSYREHDKSVPLAFHR